MWSYPTKHVKKKKKVILWGFSFKIIIFLKLVFVVFIPLFPPPPFSLETSSKNQVQCQGPKINVFVFFASSLLLPWLQAKRIGFFFFPLLEKPTRHSFFFFSLSLSLFLQKNKAIWIQRDNQIIFSQMLKIYIGHIICKISRSRDFHSKVTF